MADTDAVGGSGVGLPPGTLYYTGDRSGPVAVTVIDYSEEHFEEKRVDDVEECFPYMETDSLTWMNIDGIHQVDIVEKTGRHFRASSPGHGGHPERRAATEARGL